MAVGIVMNSMRFSLLKASLIFQIFLSFSATSCQALTIISYYRREGTSLDGIGTAEAPSSNMIGGGDFARIFRAAASVWEGLIHDDFTLTLEFGWYPTEPISLFAYHQGTAVGGTPQREIRGSIAFNNDGRRWFLDPTPFDNSEFGPLSTLRADFGTGYINSMRRYAPLNPATIGSEDFLSVALHEIGHAIGLSGWGYYENEVADGDIDLTTSPFVGASIPINESHIDYAGPLMSSRGHPVGTRPVVSDLDLLAVSQVSHFTQFVLPPRSDFDGDRDVDAADLATWTTFFGMGDYADVNGDRMTDGADFLAWQRQMTDPIVDAKFAQIPEATAMQLAAGASVLFLCRKLRRAVPA